MGRPKRKAVSNTVEKAKKARGETNLKDGLTWKMAGEQSAKAPYIHPLMVLDSQTLPGKTKIAGFDIDWTLIATKSGAKFANGPKDWKWLYDCVPAKLKELHNDGYRVMFVTNQAGIEKNKTKPEDCMTKFGAIIEELDIPVVVLICTGQNHFRKPATDIWDYFIKNSNQGVEPDKSNSFYIGDAAGRAKDWSPGKPKDFSCSDRMFAANAGIGFQTPEEFFLKEKPAKFDWKSFDAKKYMENIKTKGTLGPYHVKEKELVVMVGPPACGKSSFSARHFKPHGYEIVNRDTLGTPAKCMKNAGAALAAGKSVVVDNTNPAVHTRADYVQIAENAGASCRCFLIQTPLDLVHHLNYYRVSHSGGEVRRIPDVAYNIYKRDYVEPTTDEGFKSVTKIDWVPCFKNDKERELFKQWTTGGH